MIASLHELCLFQLDHPLNRALVCGERWPGGSTKELILNYNLIHLFVVSGAHALFFERILKEFGINNFMRISTLGLYVLCCDFSSPISRCFLERLVKRVFNNFHIFLPSDFSKLISFVVCLPLSIIKGEILSLILSLYFAFVVSSITNSKSFEVKVMLISMPAYITVLGLPPFSSLLVLICITPVIGVILLPLSFMALISDNVEWLSHMIWWLVLDFIRFLEIFFNYPKKQSANFDNIVWIIVHLIVLFIFTYFGCMKWRRKLYFT
jgi:hypothetical protein